MTEQTVMWDGHLWQVRQTETQWVLSRTVKRRMYPFEERVPLEGHLTLADALATLDARLNQKLAAETSETPAGQRAEEAGYQQTKAIIGALERGMPMEQIEAALEGRPHRPGRQVARCPRCGATGYDGEYPFSTGYPSGLCDDCGG